MASLYIILMSSVILDHTATLYLDALCLVAITLTLNICQQGFTNDIVLCAAKPRNNRNNK